MKVQRAKLVRHLHKIACGKQVTEAIFSKAFAVNALTPDQLLLVIAPPLKGVELLESEIGITDLTTMIKSLGVAHGEGNETVDVELRVEKHKQLTKLVIDEAHRGVLRLMTAQPRTIGTRVEPDTVKKLQGKSSKKEGIALTQALVDGIRETFALFKAGEVTIVAGPEGGMFQVGNDTGHTAEFASPELVADEECTVLVGEAFVDVLSVITDYDSAVLYLGGAGKVVSIEDAGFKYILCPRARSVEEKDPVEEDEELAAAE